MGARCFVGVVVACCVGSGAAAGLTPLEQRWLDGIAPVLAFARATKFPLDVIVQPQPTPGLTPLGMAFVDGRCKLVFSMRGNPKAQATIDTIEPALRAATLELMAAHELGHCERYLEGAFDHVPAGFGTATPPSAGETTEPTSPRSEQAVRREEAYGDLVGLAWTRQRHPQLYARLHAWLVAERSTDDIRGSDHDTTAWLTLVRDGDLLADPAMFANATTLWARGLHADD